MGALSPYWSSRWLPRLYS